MTTYFRVSVDTPDYPPLKLAGWIATQFFIHLVGLSARCRLNGHFTGKFADYALLADDWGIPEEDTPVGMTPDMCVSEAVWRLVQADVLVFDADGGFHIVDWAGCHPESAIPEYASPPPPPAEEEEAP